MSAHAGEVGSPKGGGWEPCSEAHIPPQPEPVAPQRPAAPLERSAEAWSPKSQQAESEEAHLLAVLWELRAAERMEPSGLRHRPRSAPPRRS
eukprot:TRINITY_DN66663_c0_g1_i1.p5 TRINITY_DN66663_c0_g1~~TRINITY_DN66663_c0_g1_i1.p5  ORF type:complete len:103 (-),score=17.88 TRINITY_DN66663_c0_g1_i1:33-308(-)